MMQEEGVTGRREDNEEGNENVPRPRPRPAVLVASAFPLSLPR